ncbi:uncharacterized protein Z518_09582 [Rhinocladiella mackenziei CBS 650.93]|uniref:Uncharacterized protein n=1 Tax=Rhinocladiella mackenziei CBS 650.93 TaxID=1442369 RepID=A0A0D2IYZ7_9EURO|nr:uncharacterized protein Z518_09582 [Rhinocladiella mackenziei CBS 650.93]KIX01855.1 hypothetical protein Z518_09582 [Rhinocladiella mackenziei CBS 650.93]
MSKDLATKAQSVLDVAVYLLQVLNENVKPSFHEFLDVLLYLPLRRKELTPGQYRELGRKGVALWSTCCKLGRNDASPEVLTDYTYEQSCTQSKRDLARGLGRPKIYPSPSSSKSGGNEEMSNKLIVLALAFEAKLFTTCTTSSTEEAIDDLSLVQIQKRPRC